MTGYRLTLDAKSDLVQIRTYTLKQWGKAQSQKYFAQLRKTIRMLSDNHALGKRQQDVGLNVLSFPYSSHVIEEFVARLCEAELATRNGKLRDVMWSGSIKAPDGGVDVRVTISSGEFDGDFVPRLDTVLQRIAPLRPMLDALKQCAELLSHCQRPVHFSFISMTGHDFIAGCVSIRQFTFG